MDKYRHVIGIGIQNTLVYRVNFLFRATFGLIPLAATLYLWKTIYSSNPGKEQVAGYTLGAMVSYYLVMTVVDALTAVTEDDWQIAAEIREGTISQFLLKPIDYLTYRLCLFLAGRTVYTVVAALPVGVFVLCQLDYLTLQTSWGVAACFGVSVVMTALLQFLLSYTMALLAFWLMEVSSVIFILFAFEYLAGGHLFPLDILPPAVNHAIHFTPFPYQLYFPVSILLGRVTGSAIWQGLVIQLFWVIAIFCLARWVWNRGCRRYSAFGG